MRRARKYQISTHNLSTTWKNLLNHQTGCQYQASSKLPFNTTKKNPCANPSSNATSEAQSSLRLLALQPLQEPRISSLQIRYPLHSWNPSNRVKELVPSVVSSEEIDEVGGAALLPLFGTVLAKVESEVLKRQLDTGSEVKNGRKYSHWGHETGSVRIEFRVDIKPYRVHRSQFGSPQEPSSKSPE